MFGGVKFSATSSDDDDGPDPTTSTSRGLFEEVTQASPAAPEETPDLVEEEATSTREAPRHIQRHHPPQQMLGDLNERVTRSKVTSIAGIAHQHLLPLLSPKILDTLFFILIWSMPCMRNLKILKETKFGF